MEESKDTKPEAATAEPEEKKTAAAEGSEPEESAEKATEPAAETRSAETDDEFRARILRALVPKEDKPADRGESEVLRAVGELTRTVQEQGKQLEKMRAEAAKREKDATRAEITRSLNEQIGQGKIRAADVDKLAGELAGMSKEGRELVLRSMTISQAPDLGSEVTIETEDGSNVVRIDRNRYRTGDRETSVQRSVQIEIEKLRASCVGEDGVVDQQKFDRGLIALKQKGVA